MYRFLLHLFANVVKPNASWYSQNFNSYCITCDPTGVTPSGTLKEFLTEFGKRTNEANERIEKSITASISFL